MFHCLPECCGVVGTEDRDDWRNVSMNAKIRDFRLVAMELRRITGAD